MTLKLFSMSLFPVVYSLKYTYICIYIFVFVCFCVFSYGHFQINGRVARPKEGSRYYTLKRGCRRAATPTAGTQGVGVML